MSLNVVRMVLFLIVIGLAAPATATVVKKVTLNDLAKSSPLIIDGRVDSVRTFTRQGPKDIYTETVFYVHRVLKGMLSKRRFVLVQLGGIKGRWGRRISGNPTFRLKTRVIIFLWRNPKGGPWVVNALELGRFHVKRNPKTGKLEVSQTVKEVVMYDPHRKPANRVSKRTLLDNPQAYDTFVQNVRRMIHSR